MSLGEVSQVQQVQATVISSSDIRVTWIAPDAGGSGFTIERYMVRVYRQGSASVEKTVEIGGSQTTTTLTALSENSTYRIEVAATNGQNTGAPSQGTLVTTEEKSNSSKDITTANCFVC